MDTGGYDRLECGVCGGKKFSIASKSVLDNTSGKLTTLLACDNHECRSIYRAKFSLHFITIATPFNCFDQ